MKSRELMIGDWVRCSDPTPFRVQGIYNDDPWMVEDEQGLKVCLGDVEPIPLTEEILVANGFTFSFDSFWSFCKNDFERIMLRFCKENEDMTENTFSYFKNHWIFDENYRIDYVHELQHAIRICGLGELADNFTVKEYAE